MRYDNQLAYQYCFVRVRTVRVLARAARSDLSALFILAAAVRSVNVERKNTRTHERTHKLSKD